MAYAIVTADQVSIFSGENVDATATAAMKEAVELMGISRICGWARYNIADNYASLNADYKKIIDEYLARLIATASIAYNMAGFSSRLEAENMLNINLFEMTKIEDNFFKDQKWWTYAKGV